MTDEITILPCPCCNGEASLSYGYMGYNTIGHFVECIDCGMTSHMNPDKEITIKEWNTRASGWVSVSDRLPEKYTRVLLFNINTYNDNRAGIHTGFIDDNKKWLSSVWTSLAIPSDQITHWQPLPSAPEVDNE